MELRSSTPRAVRRVGLHVDAVRLAAQVEVVDVDRAQVDLHGVEDVGQRDAQAERLGAVDVDLFGRLVVAERRVDAVEAAGRRVGRADDRVRGAQQRLDALVGAVLQLEREAALEAQARHRRRHDRERLRAGIEEQPLVDPVEHRRHRVRGTRPLAPRLEADEHRRLVVAGAGEAEAGDVEDVGDLRLLVQDGLDVALDAVGVVERDAFARLHRDDREALVLVGNETGRDVRVGAARHDQRDREADQHEAAPAHDRGQQPAVAAARRRRWRG